MREADGFYIGPNDTPQSQLLRQQYNTKMSYNDNQDIAVKYQDHHQAVVSNLTPPQSSALQQVFPTSYILMYDDYATGSFSAGSYTYVQPHAPRTLVVKPTVPTADNDPRIAHKKLQYDANGNLTSVAQNITTPGAPLADTQLLLRQYRWDEENRLRAVDLQPENPTNQPKIAAYTYDASGQRVVRYVPEQLKAYFSGHPSGRAHQLEIAVYPSGFISAKALTERGIHKEYMTYTKHFYIGSQRVASVKGGSNGVGRYLSSSSLETASSYFGILQEKQQTATQALAADYAAFTKTLTLPQPFALSPVSSSSYRQARHTYWFHPDHLGSSSYISTINGTISQHIEYFPFGETLVEEHKNSNNSPYKFNSKMLDAETGNYYYGARYYNPKWSLWLSVDPLAEKYPGWSPYNYTLYNPILFIDPDGRMAVPPDDYKVDKQGNISLLRKTDDNFDVLYNSDESAGIQVDKGVLGNKYSQTGTDSKGDVFSYDILKVRGDEKASSLFEFVTGNTDVEWSQTLLGKAGEEGLNYLTTSHDKGTEKGIVDMINTQFQNGYSIRGHIHNHPGNTPIPSGIPGLTGKGGDMGFATGVTNWYNGKYPGRATPFFKIYTPKNGQYINYNKNSTAFDFITIQLPEVIIKK